MSAGVHTPGPWMIDPDDDGCVISGRDAPPIAHVYQHDDFPCWDGDDDCAAREEEFRANAALIASAPDLHAQLAAVRAALASIAGIRLPEGASPAECVEFLGAYVEGMREQRDVETAWVIGGYRLLACPFCGGRPEMKADRSGEDCMDTWVRCTDCGASTDRWEGAYSEPHGAASLWNARTVEDLRRDRASKGLQELREWEEWERSRRTFDEELVEAARTLGILLDPNVPPVTTPQQALGVVKAASGMLRSHVARLQPNASRISKTSTDRPESPDTSPVQVLRVCPGCHVVAEFDAHPDDVPETCPGCGHGWLRFTAHGEVGVWPAVLDPRCRVHVQSGLQQPEPESPGASQ